MVKIINDDCLQVMKELEDNSIDFIVTDPPYGLKFMNKKWDYDIPSIDIWKEALRICKPGSMLAAFGGSRTHHRLMCSMEDAGWEIRDVIMWLYGQGFPKSHNKFGLDGYGTALKPAYEPIILAMKSLDGTYKQNVEKWGIGGINIYDSRIGINREVPSSLSKNKNGSGFITNNSGQFKELNPNIGRWPTNVILEEEAAEQLDLFTGILKSGKPGIRKKEHKSFAMRKINKTGKLESGLGDSGGASRFFYCAKASRSERNKNLENLEEKPLHWSSGTKSPGTFQSEGTNKKSQNNHPTVKPISLMKYIIKLLAPPNNPILLDPFCGSGSTLLAAKELGIESIGIELNEEYFEIANKRCA